jgi:hypothetical protein
VTIRNSIIDAPRVLLRHELQATDRAALHVKTPSLAITFLNLYCFEVVVVRGQKYNVVASWPSTLTSQVLPPVLDGLQAIAEAILP